MYPSEREGVTHQMHVFLSNIYKKWIDFMLLLFLNLELKNKNKEKREKSHWKCFVILNRFICKMQKQMWNDIINKWTWRKCRKKARIHGFQKDLTVELSEMRILAQKSGWRGLEREHESWHIPRSAPLWTSCDPPASHPSPREASRSPQTITSPSLISALSAPAHMTSSIHLTADIWQELLCSCEPKKSCCNVSASPSATCVLCEHYASKQLQTVAGERNGALLENRHAPLGKFLLMRSGLGITEKMWY